MLYGGPPIDEPRIKEERERDSDNIFMQRAALIYNFNNRNVLKFFYGKAINTPSVKQTLETIMTDLPELSNEVIETFELNYTSLISSKISVETSIFRSGLKDLIVRALVPTSDTTNTVTNRNVGEIENYGLEVTLKSSPFDNFNMQLSGTYQVSKDEREEFKDIDVDHSPKFIGYAKFAYRPYEKVKVALTANYVDKMYATWNVTKTGGERSGDLQDSHILLHSNIRVDNIFNYLYSNLRISNLLDKEYSYPTTRVNRWADKGIPGQRRHIVFTVGYNF